MPNVEALSLHNWVNINCSVEEHDAVEEFKATQVAQGWMTKTFGGHMRLTNTGYLQHLRRAKRSSGQGACANVAPMLPGFR